MKHWQEQPSVSVIVPNYNHERFLSERFNSILRQTFQDFELIVLDDASTDESLSTINLILTGLPFRLNANQTNSGSPCSQWLKGIAMATGRYIWIAESDDSCEAIFLEEMVNAMEQGHCLSYCKTASIDEQNRPAPGNPYWPDCIDSKQWQATFAADCMDFNNRYMTTANCIPNASSVVFRRDRASSCFGISRLLASLLYVGDWIFWHHYLCASIGSLHYDHRSLCHFRYHSSTTRATSERQAELRRFREYSTAVDYILSHSAAPLGWTRLAKSGDWDWLLNEYIGRYRPSIIERLLTRGLHGRLAWSVWLRVLVSQGLRDHYFFADVLHQRRRLLSAQCKHILKARVSRLFFRLTAKDPGKY
jgi:glycosyltransferase involved in cell wall biosynthesis